MVSVWHHRSKCNSHRPWCQHAQAPTLQTMKSGCSQTSTFRRNESPVSEPAFGPLTHTRTRRQSTYPPAVPRRLIEIMPSWSTRYDVHQILASTDSVHEEVPRSR